MEREESGASGIVPINQLPIEGLHIGDKILSKEKIEEIVDNINEGEIDKLIEKLEQEDETNRLYKAGDHEKVFKETEEELFELDLIDRISNLVLKPIAKETCEDIDLLEYIGFVDKEEDDKLIENLIEKYKKEVVEGTNISEEELFGNGE